jgi:long-chain acyl-CoA synthetase
VLNLADIPRESAARSPGRPAIVLGDQEISAAALASMADRAASLFEASGLRSGDRIAIVLPNVPQFPVAYYGALRLGLQVVPLSPLLSERELGYVLEDSGARAIVGWSAFEQATADAMAAAKLEHGWTGTASSDQPTQLPNFMVEVARAQPRTRVAPTRPDDVAVILYTSGTTGDPKGAALTHSNLAWNARITGEHLEYGTDDVALCILPFFHSFGQTALLNAGIDRDMPLVLMPRFDPAGAMDLIEQQHVTKVMGVPSMLAAILAEHRRQPRDTSSLRWLASGGSALMPALHAELEETFGVPLYQGYGLSETSPMTHLEPLHAKRSGTVGRPVWGIEQRIVDGDGDLLPTGEIGEIQVRGHAIMAGYHNKPEVTAACIDADGWFATGDLGSVDEDGYLTLAGRAKELIIRNGLNVYPAEIEAVLTEHHDVLLAAVVGFPDDAVGEEIAALVVLREGASADASDLQDFMREQVAAYKYPRVIKVVDALPLGPTGKVLKRSIDVDSLALAERL